jgi:hypothetical protein
VPDVVYTTKAGFAVRYLTAVNTQGTRTSFFIMGRFCGKAVSLAALRMDLGNLWCDFREMATDAICAEPNYIRDRLSRFFTVSASSHEDKSVKCLK